jgi:hypothetical protein
VVDAGLGQLAQVGEQRGGARLRVLAEVEAAGDGLLDGGEVAAEKFAVAAEHVQFVLEVVAKLRDRRLVRLVLTERGRSLEGVIAAETDKVTERALATFGPGERETVIRALAAIRRNLTGA